jgi:hypothetical protein
MSYSLVQPVIANRGQTGGQYFQIGRVKSIVLGPYKGNTQEVDPDYGSASDIGKIRYELLYSPLGTSKSDQVSEPAYPMFSFLKQYPVVNEIVFIITGPSERLNDRVSNQQFFYLPPYDTWNTANHGAFPNMSEYAQFLNQFVNQPGYSGNATSGSLPLGYTFQEKETVKNLRPFEGDIIMQARFGQSIRFGSTVPVMKEYNTWSQSGTNGSPITIISNSQGKRSTPTKFDPIVEDINRDGSAIWMTSDQQISLEDINTFPLSSFGVSINPIVQNVVKLQQLPTSDEIISAKTQDENTRS